MAITWGLGARSKRPDEAGAFSTFPHWIPGGGSVYLALMKRARILSFSAALAFAAFSFLPGCSTDQTSLEQREKIFYYDRNGDGKADLEAHQLLGKAEADWDLRDDDHNGRYEKRVPYGYGVVTVVDLPVPTDVPISRLGQ